MPAAVSAMTTSQTTSDPTSKQARIARADARPN